MKRLVCVELMEVHPRVNYYTIRFADEPDSLFDQFLDNHSHKEFETDINVITYWIDKIGETGALERYFKPEGHPHVKAIPVPPPKSKLRLYCFRLSDSVLILGGGKEKKVRTYQEDPELWEQVKIVKKTGIKLLRFIAQGRTILKDQLSGKLTFEIEL